MQTNLKISYYLMLAIATVESNNEPTKINEPEEAYGLFQVRQSALHDVNRKLGITTLGFTLEDCLDGRIAMMVFQLYISIYATRERLGREPTDEDIARIWNGGPNGFRHITTLPYWEKVKKALKPYAAFYTPTENNDLGR